MNMRFWFFEASLMFDDKAYAFIGHSGLGFNTALVSMVQMGPLWFCSRRFWFEFIGR